MPNAPFMARITLFAVSCCGLPACNGVSGDVSSPPVSFEPMGLDGYKVSELTAHDNNETLYAVTDKGLFALVNDIWEQIGDSSWTVHSLAVLYPSHLIVSATVEGDHFLMESLNSGADWNPVESDFGGEKGARLAEAPRKLLFDDSTGIMHAVGLDVLARSDDFGRSWSILDGTWQAFATGLSALIQQPNSSDLWIGGQGAIENPVLRQVLSNGAAVFDHSEAAAALLDVPSTVKSVRFAPQNNQIIVSGEGGIIHSLDGGQNWNALHTNDNSRFYFDVIVEPQNNDVMYTAGWDKNFDDPQPLILEVSADSGASWLEYRYLDDSIRGGVWSMNLRQEGAERILYLGLCNGGVVRAVIRR